MSWSVDARVPVVFGTVSDAGEGDALLIEGDAAAPQGVAVARFDASAHAPGCACCAPRGAAGAALGALFIARARGEVGFFRRVVAVVADRAGLRLALETDPVAAARFRPEACDRPRPAPTASAPRPASGRT